MRQPYRQLDSLFDDIKYPAIADYKQMLKGGRTDSSPGTNGAAEGRDKLVSP